MPSVATVGDVSPTPGTTPFTGAKTGTWTPGAVAYTSYAPLRSRGVNAISEARCTFSFSGSTEGGSTVTGSEEVVLRAASTVLQKGAAGVIVDGDSATGTFGNRLSASTAEPLKTR
jgi:hypothetical protein